MEQTDSSENDRPEIRRRLECIQSQRALIEDLATRLKVAQLEYDRLEKELNAYRASIAPIRKCPEEVLLMIFEAFSEGAPEFVAGLLHVCKQWHRIAINSPQLWTHIHIKIKPTCRQKKAARRDQEMIMACLKHSASLPLHINVDLKHMLTADLPAGHFESLLEAGCDNDIFPLARTISMLVGRNGRHMDRWKSLRIFLPPSLRNDEAIWTLFCGPTPRLRELFIWSKGLWKSCLLSSTGPANFSDLSSLENLTLEIGEVIDLDFLPLTFPSVKRLDMETNIHNSLQLSRFTNLEYLNILFYEELANTNSALEVICLPLLRDLTFHVYGSTKMEWHAPILQRLEIVGWIDNGLKALPAVRASRVCWRHHRRNYTTKIEASLLYTLERIISEYGDMQELSIRASLKPIWDKYVQGLNEETRLALPAVDFSW